MKNDICKNCSYKEHLIKEKCYSQEELDALLHKKWMDTIHKMQKANLVSFDKKLNVLEKNILTLPTIQEGEYVGVCKDDIKLEFAKFRR